MLENLFAKIDELSKGVEPCSDSSSIDKAEEKLGYKLPDDLKTFYRRYRSLTFYETDEHGVMDWFTCRFVPATEMHRTRIDIFGEESDEDYYGPPFWITICDLGDSNFIALDLQSGSSNERNYILCDHEVFGQPGDSPVIARTFTELLSRVMYGPEFWFGTGFMNYGDALLLTPETASRRIENPEAPEKGWLVKFSHKGRAFSGFFADDDYGGKDKSFLKVKELVEHALLE